MCLLQKSVLGLEMKRLCSLTDLMLPAEKASNSPWLIITTSVYENRELIMCQALCSKLYWYLLKKALWGRWYDSDIIQEEPGLRS